MFTALPRMTHLSLDYDSQFVVLGVANPGRGQATGREAKRGRTTEKA
jgi:hypothetical protein